MTGMYLIDKPMLAEAVLAQSAGVMPTAAGGLRAGTDFAPYWRYVVRISP